MFDQVWLTREDYIKLLDYVSFIELSKLKANYSFKVKRETNLLLDSNRRGGRKRANILWKRNHYNQIKFCLIFRLNKFELVKYYIKSKPMVHFVGYMNLFLGVELIFSIQSPNLVVNFVYVELLSVVYCDVLWFARDRWCSLSD